MKVGVHKRKEKDRWTLSWTHRRLETLRVYCALWIAGWGAGMEDKVSDSMLSGGMLWISTVRMPCMKELWRCGTESNLDLDDQRRLRKKDQEIKRNTETRWHFDERFAKRPWRYLSEQGQSPGLKASRTNLVVWSRESSMLRVKQRLLLFLWREVHSPVSVWGLGHRMD